MASAASARYSAVALCPSVFAISSAARSATVTASSSCWLHARARPTRPKVRARREPLSGTSSSGLPVEAGDGGCDAEAERTLKARGDGEQLVRFRGQPREATPDHLPHPFGNTHLLNAVPGGPASILVVKLPGLDEVQENLADEK